MHIMHALEITIPMASVSQRTMLSESKIRYEIELLGTAVQNYQDISLMLTKGERDLQVK